MSDVGKKLTVVVVSYNTREMTLECLRSLSMETSVPYDLIVVDNASSDGSADAIAVEFPGATLLAESTNHGFAKANNIAAQRATGDLLLLLNPDTIVLDRAVDRLTAFAERTPEARIWGGKTVHPDGSLNPSNCWGRITPWRALCRLAGLDVAFPNSGLLNGEAYGGWDRSTEREVDIVSGCFFMIDRGLWDRLDGFDLRFVMYGEEADLCHRARPLGARPRITPTAEIIHYGGASETVRSQKHVRLLQAKISLARRHLSPMRAFATTMLLRAWPLSRKVAATMLAKARPTVGRKRVAHEWGEVWADREVWWNGYPATPEPIR